MDNRRFARSRNSFFFGVCAGLAEYTGLNVTLVRVLWALLTLTSWVGGLAVIAYIVLLFVMLPPEGTPDNQRYAFRNGASARNLAIVASIALIYWGVNIIISQFFDIGRYLFPAGLILLGALLLAFAFRSGKRP